ncbi:hypothetical protein CY34DRAFT_805227 [Suillus luteus UH-Slu-Lm8-n1]|uniref:Uncharacterized protein n=1 Tax=Suillus luteus UH-Slu-Lm8-n1 TaxID=930992 RepID=A0A0C9ZWI6_9AGAM|nr:hypothetical protein CY34DRAFT_805227 [Suillus luteus UH-Slu-Lm8-n1]
MPGMTSYLHFTKQSSMPILPPPSASELLKSRTASYDRQSEASEIELLLISYPHGFTKLSLTFHCTVVIPLYIPQPFAALTQ